MIHVFPGTVKPFLPWGRRGGPRRAATRHLVEPGRGREAVPPHPPREPEMAGGAV